MNKKNLMGLILVTFIMTVSLPAHAEHEISASYRLQGWTIQNPSFDADADDDESFWRQRFRVAFRYIANENVTGNLRADFSEGDWGTDFNDYNGWASTREDAEIAIDYANLQIDQSMYKLTIGQHWTGVGNYIIWDQNATGITLDLKTALAVKLNYSKMDERGSRVDEDGTEDIDFYGANVNYTTDNFSADLIFATRQDQSDQDLSPWAAGIHTKATLGVVDLNVEVNQFGGTWGEDVDVVGTQAFLEGSMQLQERGRAGLRLFYAMGTDEDDEVQATGINAGSWDFNPLGFGDTSTYKGEMLWEFFPAGTLDGWFYGGGTSVFDPAGANGGVVGFSPYAFYDVTETVIVFANLGYLSPQEDSNTELNSLTSLSLSADWNFVEAVYLSVGYNYTLLDADDDSGDDPRSTILTQIIAKF